MNQYKLKYLKYKQKYLRLSDQIGSGRLAIVKLDSTLIEDEVDDDIIVQLNDLQTSNYVGPVSLKSKNYMIKKKDSGFYSIKGDDMESKINYMFESNIPSTHGVPSSQDNVVINIVDFNRITIDIISVKPNDYDKILSLQTSQTLRINSPDETGVKYEITKLDNNDYFIQEMSKQKFGPNHNAYFTIERAGSGTTAITTDIGNDYNYN